MPIEYFVTDKGSFVFTYAYGKVQAADIVAHEQRVIADARVTAGFRQLLDCRWVSEDADADELLSSLAEAHARPGVKLRGARYAIVAHGAQWFNLGSQYRCGQAGVTLIVFNDPGTACIWLGVNYAELSVRLKQPVPLVSPIPSVLPAY